MTQREERIAHKADQRRDPIEVLKREIPIPVPRKQRKVEQLEHQNLAGGRARRIRIGMPSRTEDSDPDTDDVIAGVRGGERRLVQLGTPLGAIAVLALSAWVLVALMHWIAARHHR